MIPYQKENAVELQYCPVFTCSSFLILPEFPLPCARHGTVMVNYSDLPIEKKLAMRIKSVLLKRQYVTHKIMRKK